MHFVVDQNYEKSRGLCKHFIHGVYGFLLQVINDFHENVKILFNLPGRYGRDGANYTSRAIFDCYYNEHDNSSVVLDYQPNRFV